MNIDVCEKCRKDKILRIGYTFSSLMIERGVLSIAFEDESILDCLRSVTMDIEKARLLFKIWKRTFHECDTLLYCEDKTFFGALLNTFEFKENLACPYYFEHQLHDWSEEK